MAERDPERRAPRAQLWVGPGRRARETAALVAALAALDGEGMVRSEPPPLLALGDLEELLVQRGRDGLLILEAARVPGEDIGFVRRFLERHPARRLVVVGADQGEARALLALERALWLAWPPHAEALRALWVEPAPVRARGADDAREPRPAPRASAPPPAHNGGGHDLRALLEELLASAMLLGEGTARFQLRGGAACPVRADRAALADGLGGLVELARTCAGSEGLVRAFLDPAGDAVRVELDFPRAALADADLALERPASALAPPLDGGWDAGRRGAERLRTLGARVVLAASEPGRVRCEVRLGAPPERVARPTRLGKPEDPFA